MTSKQKKQLTPPAKIKIGGCLHTVSYVKKPRSPDTGVAVWGLQNAGKCEIVVADHLNKDREKEVLLHEVGHALLHHFSVELPSLEKEEAIVEAYSTGLIMILRDNPKLVKYLLDGLDEKH